jgi:hypothetical protein
LMMIHKSVDTKNSKKQNARSFIYDWVSGTQAVKYRNIEMSNFLNRLVRAFKKSVTNPLPAHLFSRVVQTRTHGFHWSFVFGEQNP